MAKKFTRILAMLLVLASLFGMLSVGALATQAEGSAPQAPTEVGNNYPLNKTATTLNDKDQTTVTLSVPAEEVSLGVDIVYVAGAYLKKDQVENDLMVESLYETFKEAIKAGVPVSFGFVPFSYDDQPVMDLNTHKYDTVEKLEADFRNDLRQAIEDASGRYGGENMENALQIAKNMFAASDLADHPERQHLVLVSSGHTYNFNVGENNDIFSTVPVAINSSEKAGKYFYGYKAWMQARNYNPNNYPIPKAFTTHNDYRDWDAYWKAIDQWATADVAAGDKVVYNILDTTDYSFGYGDWYTTKYLNQDSAHDDKTTFKSYGLYIHTATQLALDNGFDFANVPRMTRGSLTGSAANIADNVKHALSYERAMWEASNFIDKEITGTGINFYPIYNQMKPEYTNGTNANAEPYAHNVDWTNQFIGHSFMNMLARNVGMDEAINNSTATNKAFFDPIKEAILYTVSNGTKVTDAIGYDAKEGNFEFVTDASTIKLQVNGEAFTTTMNSSTTDENGKIITATYSFTDAEGERKFSLDYFYGDGKEGEYFDWNFHTDVSMKDKVSLTYDLQLTEKSQEAGTHKVNTNRFAVLYPKDSDGNDGIPQLFPVPNVEYEVVPYDVDIVLALGAGIAQYDADNSKGTNTYDSIVALVEPLITQGINVNLGMVTVEHAKDVAMDLTTLTKDNYKNKIQSGLEAIQSLPAGPTNLESSINSAHKMLDADTKVPAKNKFFHVIATGRTYCFDDAAGNPATIVNQVSLKGKTYYYWGHYLWQSQRGRHTSLYMIPDGNWDTYWAKVVNWVKQDGDKYVYTFPIDNYNDPNWYTTYYNANTKDAKALGLASSRFGWIFQNPEVTAEQFITTQEIAAIGSGASPENALNYERGQYDAYEEYQSMLKAGYNCYALCSESVNYQNDSPYIDYVKYTGSSRIQLGHSYMNFLAQSGGQTEATLLFQLLDNNGNYKMAENFFAPIDVDKLVTEGPSSLEAARVPMFSAGPKGPKIITQPVDAEGELGDTVSVSVEATGSDLKYQWYFKNANASQFSASSTKTNTYETELTAARVGRELYCVITDASGKTVTTDTVKLNKVAGEAVAIVEQPVSVEGKIGDTLKVSVTASGDGLKYQWYFKNATAAKFSASSTKTSTYETQLTAARVGRELYCVITDEYGNTVTTETVTLNKAAGAPLVIEEQPVSVEGKIGDTLKVSVKASGDGLKYQWYFKNATAAKFSASSTKTSTYETQLTAARVGRELYCVITDENGNKVTTETVKLTKSASEPAAIVEQPVNVEGKLGETVKVTVKASGDGLKYQWYYKNANATKFTASSTKTSTYSTELTAARVGRELYCVITDECGNKITTETVKLNLAEITPLVIEEQPVNVEGELGETVEVTVKASGDGLKYQWYFKNATAAKFSASSTKTSTYSTELTAARVDRELYCVITDAYGNKVTTETVKLALKQD